MSHLGEPVMVEACPRDGGGGSPIVVLLDGSGLGDQEELAAIVSRADVSHGAVLYGDRTVGRSRLVRFFTCEGELPSCGHGSVAAIAVLALRGPGVRFDGVLRAGGKDFEANGDIDPEASAQGVVEAWFDQGMVRRRPATAAEQASFLAALGLGGADLNPNDEVLASPGRERLLIPVVDREVLAGLQPDQRRLAAVSREFDQLVCFVYVPPTPAGRAADTSRPRGRADVRSGHRRGGGPRERQQHRTDVDPEQGERVVLYLVISPRVSSFSRSVCAAGPSATWMHVNLSISRSDCTGEPKRDRDAHELRIVHVEGRRRM